MKKFLLSAFVVASFSVFAIIDRLSNLTQNTALSSPINFGPNNLSSNPKTAANTNYKDGTYTGISADAFYGNIQVKAIISGGKITDVQFLDYPQDRRNSIEINSQAMPLLKSEAIQIQNANVDIISGATATSQAFVQSLQSALNQAQ
jgi:uncharacterized protein with FMN-binding domain